MRSTALAGALVVVLLAAAKPADAQRPSADQHTAFTVGLSKGAGGVACPFCSGNSKGGFAGLLAADRPIRRGVRLGLEGQWWMHSSGGAARSVLSGAPIVRLQPFPAGPLFLKVGVGVGRFTASSDEEELRTTSLVSVIGVGWELQLSDRSAVAPYVSWLRGSGGAMRLNGALVTGMSGPTLFQYGLAWSRR